MKISRCEKADTDSKNRNNILPYKIKNNINYNFIHILNFYLPHWYNFLSLQINEIYCSDFLCPFLMFHTRIYHENQGWNLMMTSFNDDDCVFDLKREIWWNSLQESIRQDYVLYFTPHLIILWKWEFEWKWEFYM